MKLLALADHHFREGPRFAECIRVHEWIAELVERERPDVVVSAGDVYDRCNSPNTPTERAAVADWLQRISDVAPVVLVRGNHDFPGELPLRSRRRARHSVIVEEGAAVHRVRGVAIACVAWPQRARLAAALNGGSQAVDQTGHDMLCNVLRGLGAQMAQHDGPRILVGHLQCDGAKTSTGQELIGGAITVGLDDLALAGADCTLLGHIHLPQDFNSRRTVQYVGSPYHHTFGEPEAKRVVIAEVERGLCSLRSVETPATPMVLIDEHWNGSLLVGNTDPPDDGRGCDIRLRYHCAPDQRDAAKRAAHELAAQWLEAGHVAVKVEPVIETQTTARLPEISAAPSLAEKLQLKWQTEGFDPGERRCELLKKLGELEESHAA